MINLQKNSLFCAMNKRIVNIMRLTILFMLIGMGVSSANVIYSQSTYLTAKS